MGSRVCLAVSISIVLGAGGASAQPTIQAPVKAPLNFVVPNYNGVPMGETASLEAGAFIARTGDSSSGFFNPAGLSRAAQTSVSGSAGLLAFTSVSPESLTARGRSFQQVPAVVAFVLKGPFGHKRLAAGLSVARVNAWEQSADAEREFAVGAGNEHFTYSSHSDFSGWLASLGGGYNTEGKLRVGGSLDVQLMSSERGESMGDQLTTATAQQAVLIGTKGWFWTTHLRATIGAQYDLLPAVHIGAVMRTPGIALLKSGSYSQEGMSHIGSTTATASFFEPDGTVEYKLPLEVKAGAAWIGRRAQAEFDILVYQGTGAYNAFQSGRTMTVVTDQGLGSTTVEEQPFVSPVVDSRTVVNLAVGAQYALFEDGRVKLHSGYATDGSPVGSADTVFTKVDMQVWTAGVSLTTKHVVGAVGLRYEWGSTGEMVLRQTQSGQQIQSTFNVSSIGFVYSVAVLF